jgi:two-component SAPR family response regulator
LIVLQARVIEACEQARQYADSLYNWQRELHVNTLINQATALYQRVYEETNEASLQKAYTQMQLLLFRARDIIGELPESSFYARQVGARVEEYLEVIAPYLPDE